MKYAFISYGQGGAALDPESGERTLVKRLKAAGVNTMGSPYSWDDIHTITNQILKTPKNSKIIVGGDSLGANEAPGIAGACKHNNVQIDMLFGFQPSVWGAHIEVPDNVVNAWCIYNPSWFETLGLGAYPWSPEKGNTRTRMHMIPIHSPHPGDWGQAQDIIYKAIITL